MQPAVDPMVAAETYINIHEGRDAVNKIKTASTPPGIGINTESRKAIARRPKGPKETR